MRLSPLTIHAMGKVVPKPRRRPQGARKLEWEKIRINDLLGQLFACVQPDLGRCLEEFEYNGTVDAILEWAVKNIPRLLGYTDQRRREEVGLLYSILGGRLEAESQKAGFLPLIPAVLPSPQANRTFRHFFLDPLLAQAGFSHKRWADQAGVCLTTVREYMGGRRSLSARDERDLVQALRRRLSDEEMDRLPDADRLP